MNNYDKNIYLTYRDEFTRIYKQVQRYFESRPLTKDKTLIERYRTDSVDSYNNYVSYLAEHFNSLDDDNQLKAERRLTGDRDRLAKIFKTLYIEYPFTVNIFDQIDRSNLRFGEIPTIITEGEKETADSGAAGTSTSTDKQSVGSLTVPAQTTRSTHSSIESLYENELVGSNEQNLAVNDNENNPPENLVRDENVRVNTPENSRSNSPTVDGNLGEDPPENLGNVTPIIDEMPQSAPNFLKLAASIINYKYSGDALKLESFLTDVELVSELADNANTALCLKFVKAELEAKALECLPETINSIDDLTNALKQNIKPDTPKVVEGKLMALRLEKNNYTKFSEQLEKLAEAFRRSLISEGISKSLAQEMTVNKTVELCRKTTKSEIVKSVLSAATFDKPESVIAKFVTESDVARKEYKESQAAKSSKSNELKL